MTDKKFIFIQDWKSSFLETDDGGQALVYHIDSDDISSTIGLRIQSWDETKKHEDFNQILLGKKLKITIETI